MSQHFKGQIFTGTPKPIDRDNNAHTVPEDGCVYDDCTFDANGASEGFKSSRKWDLEVDRGQSIGGVEDCMDLVRGGNLNVYRHMFHRRTARQDVTIKGGFRRAVFNECPGLRFIVAGDYTKYDAKAIYPSGRIEPARPFKCCRPPMREGHVNVAPGQPKVWVLNFHSEPWTGDVRNLRLPIVHRLVVALYFWARAKFFKEINPANEADFILDPRELKS
jgi:hypothetical protein